MADSPKPPNGVPYPTPNRLHVLREAARGELRYYHWIEPRTWNTVTDRERTAIVTTFIAAKLAEPGIRETGADYSTVALTDAGRQYLNTYGKNGATS